MTITKKSLADLAGAFAKKTNEDNNAGGATWKLFFPFWKADVDTTSVVRFLPDLAEDNPMGFLVENLTHNLTVNGRRETVACLKMYGQECPICKQAQIYYDEKSPEFNKALGSKLYRKKSYIGQVLVNETTIEHDQEQLVKLIEFGPKIFKQIQAAFQSGDLENPPYELNGGHNFRINKTKSGEYADYGTSSFAPRTSDVSDDLIEQIELFDLAKYRAPMVPAEQLEAMLAADLAGGAPAPARQEAQEPAPARQATPKQDDADEADEAPTTAPAKLSVAEQIRQRQAARRAAEGAGE